MKRKRIGRKLGAFLLSLSLFFGAIPVGVYGAEPEIVQNVQEEQITDETGALEEGALSEEASLEKEINTEHSDEKPEEIGKESENIEEEPETVSDEIYETPIEPDENAETVEVTESEEEDGAVSEEADAEEKEEDADGAEEEPLEASIEANGITVADSRGNPLPVTVEDVENPEKILENVDYSKVSGTCVWFQEISVEKEGEEPLSVTLKTEALSSQGLENKTVTVVHFPEGKETEYIQAEILDEAAISFTLNSFSPAAVFVAEDMYHYDRERLSTILTWKEHYMPGGFEDLLSYGDLWWDSLYDYERELAEFLKGQIVELSSEVYDGQELDTCISAIEGGIRTGDFFAGTVFKDVTLEDMYSFRRMGLSLEDVYEALMFLCREGSMEGWSSEKIGEEQRQKLEDIVWNLLPANPMLRVSNGDLVADLSVTNTGYKGTSHGTIWKLTIGGKPALCLSKGKSARNGFLYNANPGTYEQRNDGIGYLVSRAGMSGDYYVCVQIALWLYQQSHSYTKTQVEERAYGMLDESEAVIEPMVATIWNNYYGATQNSRSYYVFHSDNSNAQDGGTPELPSTHTYTGGGGGNEGGEGGDNEYETGSVSASAEDSIDVEAEITISKHDSITDEPLSGAQIRVNGDTYTSSEDGEITHMEEEEYEASAEGPSYTYVKDWGGLTDEQKADADRNGYYHSRDEAYNASRGEANARMQEELDEWADDWRADFHAVETAPPYGYTNNEDNEYDTTAKDGAHKYHDFYNKPWEAWLKVTKHDSITGQTDFSLADAEFCVYEYDRDNGAYVPYRYGDRQILKDYGDGTYGVGPLYYNPANEGKFMIQETRSPFGYTIDRKLNQFYFEITGDNQITLPKGNVYNTAGTYAASEAYPHDLQAYNEPWKVRVDTVKVDEDTNEPLSGVIFDIFRFNRNTGDYEGKTSYAPFGIPVGEQTDGTYLSGWIYWNYQNQGKFYLVESEAKKGYFGDWKKRLAELITGHPAGWQDDDADGKTAYYFQITGSRTEEGAAEGYNSQKTLRASANDQGTVTNERTKGRVTVVKYDTESESPVVQGDASMEGAVYELRAAEDIIHADGHTGVIYKKGDLVMTGTVGKTPVLDSHGYVLNTAGKRYAACGGEIQYKDTPGQFSLYNIELGAYTLKEVKAGKGYMLDETTYHLTFSYKNETQRIILREESAAQDKNTLTADDRDFGHENLYTGDYVQKQAFSITKTSDNQFQTELLPVEGAGFTVYLVSGLTGVKNGNIVPANGQFFGEADIRKFYDYNFTEELPATVYKRKLETWTEGDTKWLIPAEDGDANQYHVAEMFTDKNGSLTSPELPYGLYVAVETTVPQNHVTARPFFVKITADGGVVYTDTSKQTIQNRHSEEQDIRFGDHGNRQVYKDSEVYQEHAVEGRMSQNMRYISDNQTESYLRLVKADTDALPPSGTVLKPEELVSGTVLKEGAAYRIRIESMTDREKEAFTAAGWKADEEGYIWFYELSSRKEYGTADCPFEPTLLHNAEGKIMDCYLNLPAKLPTGSYELKEIKAPSGYVKNGQEKQLRDTGTERMASYRILDAPQKAVRFVLDNQSVYPDGQMGENKYTLSDSYGNIICTVVQDNQEQKGILELIKHGEKLYDGSNVNGETKDYRFEYQDAPIEGAVFEVYAAEDIYTQELDNTNLSGYGIDTADYLVWAKDQKIAELTTDKTGYAYLADLYIGKYYIKEIYSGEGFARNPEIQTFEITPQADHINFEWVGSLYENQRQRIDLQVKKQDAEDQIGLSGAVFGLYNKQDIYSYIVKNPNKKIPDQRHISMEFDYVNDDAGRLVILADTLIATAVTGEDGVAVFDEDLPLGEYYVKELNAPSGYTSTDQIETVDASWKGQEIEIQEHTDLVFRNQRTKHVFTKTDMVSGAEIPGAYLEIWEILSDEQGNIKKNADGSYVLGKQPIDTWVSRGAGEEIHYFYEENGFYLELDSPEDLPEGKDLIQKEGHLIERLKTGRMYLLRETLAPVNYVGYEASSEETKRANQEKNMITEEVRFMVEDQNMVVSHDLKNQRTVGAFSVTKEGEFFVGTSEDLHLTDKIKNLFVTIFQYVLGRVEQASFEVYVKEDIFTPDGTGAYAEWTNSSGNTLPLKKDTLIDTITTGPFGLAEVKELPLGTYYLREIAAGDGMFLLNREEKEVVLAYVDQNTPVVFSDSTSYVNERQKISITLHKREKNTELPVQGAVFGLYAGEDLHGYVVGENKVVSAYPEPLVKKDTLLETVESDEKGLAVFRADVPNGIYYVRELQAPSGYFPTDGVWSFDASYQGESSEEVLTFEQVIYNEVSDVTVSKQDLTNGAEIEGAELVVVEESSGQTVDQWISEKVPHRIGGIQISEKYEHSYILREQLPASGYVTAEEIRFVVREQDGIRKVWIYEDDWKCLNKRCIVMKDDITKMEIRKTTENEEAMLPGAVLELLDADGQQVCAWISTEEAYDMERLPIGIYTLHEISAPAGYRAAEDMVIQVLDTSKVQKFVLKNEKLPSKKKHSGSRDTEKAENYPAETVNAAQTGDTGWWIAWTFSALLAAAGVIWFMRRRR